MIKHSSGFFHKRKKIVATMVWSTLAAEGRGVDLAIATLKTGAK